MRRLAWLGAAFLAACGTQAGTGPAPLDQLHMPTGLAVLNGRVLVASSNADLLYDDKTGGNVLTLDTTSLDAVKVLGAVNVASFAGELGVARPLPPPTDPTDPTQPDHCGGAISQELAIFATRGSNTVNVLAADASGAISCERCGIPVGGQYSDPFAVAIACGPARADAFIGYLSAQNSEGWVTKYDLTTGDLATMALGAGVVRSLTYDPVHDRLWVAQLTTALPEPLRWIDLAGCGFGGVLSCPTGTLTIPGLPQGAEVRSLALAHPVPGAPQRAFLTVRMFDPAAALLAGGRPNDYGGLLVVLDLVEDGRAGVTPQLVRIVPETGTLGRGLQDVRILPARAGLRDAVAVVAVDDGILWIYDDETQELGMIGRQETGDAAGAPKVGHAPLGLAVDPVLVGTLARVWVGSYQDSWLTPVDVPLDAVSQAAIVQRAGSPVRISGGTP